MDVERKEIIGFLSDPKSKAYVTYLNIRESLKSAEESRIIRNEGNVIFKKKKHSAEDHMNILYLYNESIACAPKESEELMLAYNNRSVFLLHLHKYKECIDDIDKVLELTKLNIKRIKLYCRKVECLTALGSPANKDVFNQVIQIFNEAKLSIDEQTCASEIIKRTKSILIANKLFVPSNRKFLKEKEEFDNIIKNKESTGPFDSLEIKMTKEMGRGLYATRDIEVGELVLVESVFVIPNVMYPFAYCYHCLRVAWNGIPCETCKQCIFCSTLCKDSAKKEYHDIECSFTAYIVQHQQNFSE
ncbi:SET and MYND domain-containing protein 4-like, partial [Trichogramma pretiosum]|uniref:SET and MYND domain-containing protein 4-like n=1 Tax=Trichogramma pretiosum TaxID=7493 RepID=UPI000C71C142